MVTIAPAALFAWVLRNGALRQAGAALLAGWWRTALVATTACYLALFPGTVLLHWWFGVTSAGLVAVVGVGALVGLFVTLPAAVAAGPAAGGAHAVTFPMR